MNLSRLASWSAEFLFPSGCILCGTSLLHTGNPLVPVCPRCVSEVLSRRIHASRCRVCGSVLTSEEGICLRCREKEYAFSSHLAPFMYQGPMQALLSAYKNGGCTGLARFFASVCAESWEQDFRDIPVVPVPSRPAALRKRGFDTTGLICRFMEKERGIPVLSLLKRLNGRQQKSFGYDDRFLNIRGKFLLKETPPASLRRVVLFDDVFTSGATADACAEVLKTGGIERVDVLTIAQD